MKKTDLVGQTIGLSRVEEFAGTHTGGQAMWKTCCVNCGHLAVRVGHNIKHYVGCTRCNGAVKGESGLNKLFKSYSANGIEKGHLFEMDLQDFQQMTSLNCHYCGVKPQQVAKGSGKGVDSDWADYLHNGLDRIETAGAYRSGNCVPCCETCSQAKGSKTSGEYTKWLDRVVGFRSPPVSAKIQVLVGMIASGKSTYCKNAASRGVIVVNDDAIVNMLHGDDYTLYSKGLKTLYKSVENHVIASALLAGRNVVVDRGLNLSVKGRQRWLALASSFDVSVEAIMFENEWPEVHATRRVASDGRGHDYAYWLKVAQFHHDHYELPTLAEGFDAVHTLSFEAIREGKVFA